MAGGDIIWTWFKGNWHQGDLPVMNAADQGTWLGSLVFDGARAFDGMVPDLEPHMKRINASAVTMGLKPTHTVETLEKLVGEGVAKFDADAPIYIRPMYWATNGQGNMIVPDAESTEFALCLEQMPMPGPDASQTLCRTQFTRPMATMATVNAKAACLYPNNARMLREANGRGYDNAIVTDALGNVAESATSNIFMVKDGVVKTPIPNGTFLNGITRQRIIRLLRDAGHTLVETVLNYEDFDAADEVFLTGNYAKITPITKIEDREFLVGPVAREARKLYWDWAAG